jgi:hypothetical protein
MTNAFDEEDMPTEEEWVTEQDETPDQIVMDTTGDVYEGLFLGLEVINWDDPKEGPQEFLQIKLWDVESPKILNASYRLKEAFEKVEVGREVRILYVKDVPIKGQPSPMKDYKVWSRPPRTAWLSKSAEARTEAGLA